MGYRRYGGLIDISVDEDLVIETIAQNYDTVELLEKLEVDHDAVAIWAVAQCDIAMFLERYIDARALQSYVKSAGLLPTKSDDEMIADLRSRYSALEISQRFGLRFWNRPIGYNRCEYATAV